MIVLFLLGWTAAVLSEYVIHWVLHRYKVTAHLNHHKDFRRLPPMMVAKLSNDLKLDLTIAVSYFLLLSPFMLIWGWAPVLIFYVGMLFHLLVVYKICHSVFHCHERVPKIISRSRPFMWWRNCHQAHHFQHPKGNYSVTFPPLDLLLGTYVKPSEHYPEDPSQWRKSRSA